jgi:competence ComEA-like helix-hairpin-helix protein
MRMRLSPRVFEALVFARWFSLLLAVAAVPLPATKKPPAHPFDINSASSVQLQEVPGIGPATADKILQMRKAYGSFKSVDDLLSVRGIGPKRLEKMRKYLVAAHAVQGRKGGASTSASSGANKPAACGSCSRAAPVKKAPVTPAKASKPVASDGDAAEADEEPE